VEELRHDFRVIFATTKYNETVAFYRDALEFPIVSSWTHDTPGIIFRAGAATLEILAAPLGDDLGKPSGFRFLIRVEDPNELHKRITAKGIQIQQELIDRPWGYREFAVADPNGIRIYFYTLSDSMAAGHG